MSIFNEVSFLTGAASGRDFPADTGIEIAFAGRSNAGKSSAINALTGRRALARTSKTPGRTQQINFFELGDDRRLVDLPGYGFAKVPDAVRRKWRALMDDYFATRESLAGLIVVIDARRPVSDLDRKMLSLAAGRPTHVLLTKADKLKHAQAARAFDAAVQDLPPGIGVQLFSSSTKAGVDEAREIVAELFAAAVG